MKWLVQRTKLEQEQINELLSILERAEISYDIVYPFEDKVINSNKEMYIYNDSEDYFVCGSYTLTRNVYKDKKRAVFSLDEYNFEDLMNIFGKENFLNNDAKIINFKDIVWNNNKYFVRPLNDDKAFNGGIYEEKDISYDGDVIIAEVKPINKEHRFFVVDGKIITSSLYKVNGEIQSSNIVDEDVIKFAENIINKFKFPGFVIDIATIGNEHKIVELNCLNASGFYDINIYKLVNAILEYYEKY